MQNVFRENTKIHIIDYINSNNYYPDDNTQNLFAKNYSQKYISAVFLGAFEQLTHHAAINVTRV